jgi:hypothetical protein
MNLQGRNLQQGLTGDDVRLLHAELSAAFDCNEHGCRRMFT